MVYVGQRVGEWVIELIDYPVGEETWVHPPGWRMICLQGPDDEQVILNVPPEDQTLDRISHLLQEELDERSRWKDKELTL